MPMIQILDAKKASDVRSAALWGDPVTFVDTETTGLGETDVMTQIAAVRVLHNLSNPLDIAIEKRFEVKLDLEGRTVPDKIAKLNGYDPEVWAREAVPRREGIRSVLELLEGSGIGGNNPSFDKTFLEREAAQHKLKWPKMRFYRLWAVDAMAIPLERLGYVENVKLDTLARFFNLGDQQHDAMSDIVMSIKVYHRLMYIWKAGTRPEVIEEARTLTDEEI